MGIASNMMLVKGKYWTFNNLSTTGNNPQQAKSKETVGQIIKVECQVFLTCGNSITCGIKTGCLIQTIGNPSGCWSNTSIQ